MMLPWFVQGPVPFLQDFTLSTPDALSREVQERCGKRSRQCGHRVDVHVFVQRHTAGVLHALWTSEKATCGNKLLRKMCAVSSTSSASAIPNSFHICSILMAVFSKKMTTLLPHSNWPTHGTLSARVSTYSTHASTMIHHWYIQSTCDLRSPSLRWPSKVRSATWDATGPSPGTVGCRPGLTRLRQKWPWTVYHQMRHPLGGGNSNMFLVFPLFWRRWSHFDEYFSKVFFSTTN